MLTIHPSHFRKTSPLGYRILSKAGAAASGERRILTKPIVNGTSVQRNNRFVIVRLTRRCEKILSFWLCQSSNDEIVILIKQLQSLCLCKILRALLSRARGRAQDSFSDDGRCVKGPRILATSAGLRYAYDTSQPFLENRSSRLGLRTIL